MGIVNSMQFQNMGGDDAKPPKKTACQVLCQSSCSLAVCILFIVYSKDYLDDTNCDTLDDGVGIAQWMFVMGIFGIVMIGIQILNTFTMKDPELITMPDGTPSYKQDP